MPPATSGVDLSCESYSYNVPYSALSEQELYHLGT